jgi:hypothetical protein
MSAHTEATRHKISAAMRAVFQEPANRERLAAVARRTAADPAIRQDRSERMRAQWASGNLADHLLRAPRPPCSDAIREARRQRMKALWQNPETRARMLNKRAVGTQPGRAAQRDVFAALPEQDRWLVHVLCWIDVPLADALAYVAIVRAPAP